MRFAHASFSATAGRMRRVHAFALIRARHSIRTFRKSKFIYCAASRAPQKAHWCAVTKLVSWAGSGGTKDWKLGASGLNFCHAGAAELLGVPNLAKLVQ